MKVWLDDERDPQNFRGWKDAVWVTTPEEAIHYLETGEVDAISLDNDLGLKDSDEGMPRDGYQVALWIERQTALDPEFIPPNVLNAHTANSSVQPKMETAFRNIRRLGWGR